MLLNLHNMAALRGMSLKLVSEVKMRFDPFHPQAVTVREFMRIISSDPLKLTNPKCKISTEIVNDGTNRGIEIAFANKERIGYNIEKKTDCQDLIIDFNLRCRSLEQSR